MGYLRTLGAWRIVLAAVFLLAGYTKFLRGAEPEALIHLLEGSGFVLMFASTVVMPGSFGLEPSAAQRLEATRRLGMLMGCVLVGTGLGVRLLF